MTIAEAVDIAVESIWACRTRIEGSVAYRVEKTAQLDQAIELIRSLRLANQLFIDNARLREALVMLMHCGPNPRMGEYKRAIQNASEALDDALPDTGS